MSFIETEKVLHTFFRLCAFLKIETLMAHFTDDRKQICSKLVN